MTYHLDTSGQQHLIPNTPITAQWRVFPTSDPEHGVVGPKLTFVYADDRFDWKTVAGDLVRVHWYEGSAAFAAKALKLGEDEVRATSQLLGVTETKPVDFFVYANTDDFYDALGPGAHENVAGTAYADIRTLLGLIPPDQIDDPLVAVRIPHEFVHLVFDTASSNPYHAPPRWLNEGLAVYQSEGYGSSDRGAVDGCGQVGHAHPARRADRPVPERPGLLPRLLGERRSGRLHGPDIRQRRARQADPVVRRGPDRRRGVHGGPRPRHDGVRRGLVQGRQGGRRRPGTDPQPAPPGPVPSAWTVAVGGGGAASGGPVASNGAPAGAPAASAGAAPAPTDSTSGSGTASRPGDRRRGRRRDRDRRPGRTLEAAVDGYDRVTMARLRAIPSWQITLGVALLALGFLVAAQLASEGPRVRYTTQERTPLVETANELQTQQDGLKDRILELRAQIQGVEAQGAARPISSGSSTPSSRRLASRPVSSR